LCSLRDQLDLLQSQNDELKDKNANLDRIHKQLEADHEELTKRANEDGSSRAHLEKQVRALEDKLNNVHNNAGDSAALEEAGQLHDQAEVEADEASHAASEHNDLAGNKMKADFDDLAVRLDNGNI